MAVLPEALFRCGLESLAKIAEDEAVCIGHRKLLSLLTEIQGQHSMGRDVGGERLIVDPEMGTASGSPNVWWNPWMERPSSEEGSFTKTFCRWMSMGFSISLKHGDEASRLVSQTPMYKSPSVEERICTG